MHLAAQLRKAVLQTTEGGPCPLQTPSQVGQEVLPHGFSGSDTGNVACM